MDIIKYIIEYGLKVSYFIQTNNTIDLIHTLFDEENNIVLVPSYEGFEINKSNLLGYIFIEDFDLERLKGMDKNLFDTLISNSSNKLYDKNNDIILIPHTEVNGKVSYYKMYEFTGKVRP